MPAKSTDQLIAARIAEHAPQKLYNRNAGLAKMSKAQLHDFVSTPRKGLPAKVRPTAPHIDKGHRQVANKDGHANKLRHG
jgi:hypothetical protein